MNTDADPLSELLTATDIVPESHRIAEFMDQVSGMTFCCAGRGPGKEYDHYNCTPIEDLDKALQLMKALNLSVKDYVRTKKGSQPETLIKYLFKRFTSKDCAYGREVEIQGGRRELKNNNDCAGYICERVEALGVSQAGVIRKKTNMPKFYYDGSKGRFWHEPYPDFFEPINETMVARKLIQAGLDRNQTGLGLTEVETALTEIVEHNGIDLATPLAGYKAGVYEVNGHRILVTRSFNLIEPALEAGSFDHITAVFRGLLENPDGETDEAKTDPYWHLLCHLQCSYKELSDGEKSGSMAVFFCGPKDVGKAILLELIVAILGGRYGNAYQYISGQTSFNDELMCKENWIIDDGVPLNDYQSQRRLSGLMKQSVAANHVPCHGKGKPQLSIPLYRRPFIAMNPEDLEMLPHMAESLEDKYMLLGVKKFSMPPDCLPLPERHERAAFMNKLKSELPFFIRWLLAQDLSAYSGRRFGVIAHKNKDLVAANMEASGLDTKYEVICELLFGTSKRAADAVEMRTSRIWIEMTRSIHSSAMTTTFRNAISLGLGLRELETSATYGKLVTSRVMRGNKYWTIRRRVGDQPSPDGSSNSNPHHDQCPDSKREDSEW